jgi:hypothetical protein
MATLGIVGLVIAGLYLLGWIVSVIVWVKLWRRSMDVNLIAFVLIVLISSSSWIGALLGVAYLSGGKVLFAKKGQDAPPPPPAQ